MIHLLNDDGFRVCGKEDGDRSTTDYHKVTCKLCEQWIKDQAGNIAAEQHKSPPSKEVVSSITDEVVDQMMNVRDQRRWELAKELYVFTLTKMKIMAGHRRDVEAYVSGAIISADALLDAFEKKHVDPDVTALIAALDKIPQCKTCHINGGPTVCYEGRCTCACHEVAACVKRLEGKA
jgi:hypothetical protein